MYTVKLYNGKEFTNIGFTTIQKAEAYMDRAAEHGYGDYIELFNANGVCLKSYEI